MLHPVARDCFLSPKIYKDFMYLGMYDEDNFRNTKFKMDLRILKLRFFKCKYLEN